MNKNDRLPHSSGKKKVNGEKYAGRNNSIFSQITLKLEVKTVWKSNHQCGKRKDKKLNYQKYGKLKKRLITEHVLKLIFPIILAQRRAFLNTSQKNFIGYFFSGLSYFLHNFY